MLFKRRIWLSGFGIDWRLKLSRRQLKLFPPKEKESEEKSFGF